MPDRTRDPASWDRAFRRTCLAAAAAYALLFGLGFYALERCGPSCDWLFWGGLLTEGLR